jgi:hypothetical protein
MRKLLFIALITLASGPIAPAQQIHTMERHNTGQNIAPIFDGWSPNADGTFSLYFGYLNRNYVETPDIPVGPDNKIDPGPDRGQPTHFLPRRQSEVFAVVVPKDFGKQKMTWALSVHGKTATATGSLNPEWQIDVQKDTTTGNTPPILKVSADQIVVLPAVATVTATVTDDGLPKPTGVHATKGTDHFGDVDRARLGINEGLTVEWVKYRGPGDVSFGASRQRVEGGRASTTVSFSAPGTYDIQAVADDGSRSEGFYCCWTSRLIKVTVKVSATQQER